MENKIVNSSDEEVGSQEFSFGLSQGEIISNYILEKLISYAITESYKNEIERNIGLHCFNFLKDMLNHMILINNIAYDREDYKVEVNQETEEEILFYNNSYAGNNDWTGICEPRKTKIDRSATSNVRVIKNTHTQHSSENELQNHLFKNNNNAENSIIDNNQNLKELNNPLSHNRENLLINLSNKKLFSNKKVSKGDPSSTNESFNTQNSTVGQNLFMSLKKKLGSENNGFSTKTSMKDEPFPNFKLENIKDFFVEDPEIKFVREEREREWKRIEDERQKKATLEVIKAEILKNENRLKSKDIDGRKITFDLNGAIINIKNVNIEKLGNDFLQARTDVKEKNDLLNSTVKTKSEKLGSQITHNKFPPVGKDKDHPIVNSKDEFPKKKGVLKTVYSESKNTTSAGNAFKIENPFSVKKQEPQDNFIQPAGSNFDMFFPETGVTVIEDGKEKKGDRDYFQKYHKYSKYDYINLLRDSINTTTISQTQSKLSKDKKLDPIQSFTNTNSFNPLPALNINRSSDLLKKSNMLGNSLESSSGYLNTISHTHIPEGIRLSHKLTMNLKNTMDNLELIPEIDEKLAAEPDIAQKNTFMDIFRKRKNYNSKSEDLEEINKFNLSIINNNKWGSDSMNRGRMEPKRKMVMKPSQKELEKELGANIANTKLPRSRLFNINKSYNLN